MGQSSRCASPRSHGRRRHPTCCSNSVPRGSTAFTSRRGNRLGFAVPTGSSPRAARRIANVALAARALASVAKFHEQYRRGAANGSPNKARRRASGHHLRVRGSPAAGGRLAAIDRRSGIAAYRRIVAVESVATPGCVAWDAVRRPPRSGRTHRLAHGLDLTPSRGELHHVLVTHELVRVLGDDCLQPAPPCPGPPACRDRSSSGAGRCGTGNGVASSTARRSASGDS
jgi:hypothetical protein